MQELNFNEKNGVIVRKRNRLNRNFIKRKVRHCVHYENISIHKSFSEMYLLFLLYRYSIVNGLQCRCLQPNSNENITVLTNIDQECIHLQLKVLNYPCRLEHYS